MKSKKCIIYSIIVMLCFLGTSLTYAKSDKKGIRKARGTASRGSSGSKSSSSRGKKRGAVARANKPSASTVSAGKNPTVNETVKNGAISPIPAQNQQNNQTVASTSLFNNSFDMATCDSKYTRCMNKVCASDTMGKCICYEDNSVNNKVNEFIDVDGMKVKQGFEAYNYAKNQCTEILDKCVDDKRLISEKYKNFVQRDCLLLSGIDATKDHGIKADLEALKECMKPACTVMSVTGYENFDYPEYSLCFRDGVAKFWMDALCSDIIAKSAGPLMLKQLFLDEMALRRERSCIYMKGELSNDRKTCRVNITYGPSKDDIKSSKYFEVGNYMECSASEFDTKKGKTREARQAQVNRALSTTATALNIAGAVLGVAGSADPIGRLVDTGIDVAEAGVNLGIDIAKYKRGELNAAQLTSSAVGNGLSIALSAVSIAGAAGKIGKAGADAAKTTTTAGKAVSGLQKAKNTLDMTQHVLTMGSEITDIAFEEAANKAQAKEEELAIVKHGVVDRNFGYGQVNETYTQRGNCFLNREWFATENELIMLLWQN